MDPVHMRPIKIMQNNKTEWDTIKKNMFWVASYIRACTNKTHSIAILQDLIPTLAAIIIGNSN